MCGRLRVGKGFLHECSIGRCGHVFGLCDTEQLLDTIASDRRDDPELRQVRADRIDHRSLLADEQVPSLVQSRAALFSGVLVATERMLGLVTASQIASASVASFLCRFT